MPRYRFMIPVRAIGSYRLEGADVISTGITLIHDGDGAYIARVGNIEASTAMEAYELAKSRAEAFLGYLALLGHDAAFILDGIERLKGRNVDLEENPIPSDQPPPIFESLFGGFTPAGEAVLGPQLDPEGSKRRTGVLAIHNLNGNIIPGRSNVDDLAALFADYGKLPSRLRVAVGIMHDAACAKEPTNAFTQCYTTLEVLTEHLKPPTVFDVFYEEAKEGEKLNDLPLKTKKALMTALEKFLIDAKLSEEQARRVKDYASNANSRSMVDIFQEYLQSLGLEATRKDVMQWKNLRGSVIHTATSDPEALESMKRFQGVIRAAVLEELRRTSSEVSVPVGQNPPVSSPTQLSAPGV